MSSHDVTSSNQAQIEEKKLQFEIEKFHSCQELEKFRIRWVSIGVALALSLVGLFSAVAVNLIQSRSNQLRLEAENKNQIEANRIRSAEQQRLFLETFARDVMNGDLNYRRDFATYVTSVATDPEVKAAWQNYYDRISAEIAIKEGRIDELRASIASIKSRGGQIPTQFTIRIDEIQRLRNELQGGPNAREETICMTPMSVTLDILAAGITELLIYSPCNSGDSLIIKYYNYEFIVEFDASGRVRAPLYGLSLYADVELRLIDGERLTFLAPFTGIDRIARVMLLWDEPIQLSLISYEFSNNNDSAERIDLSNPRNFDKVRKNGGGFIINHKAINGIGKNMAVYTHWIRRGGQGGDVNLYLKNTGDINSSDTFDCATLPPSPQKIHILSASQGQKYNEITKYASDIFCENAKGAHGEEIPIMQITIPKR